MPKELRFDQVQTDIERSITAAQLDRAKRTKALARLEGLDKKEPRRVAMFYSARHKALSQYDVLPFANMLQSIGLVPNLDLIVLSPGGDGTAAETMLDLCRKYCQNTLRVIVPLYAKSAATLLALGADEIVMGQSSELGPIDAQVFIVQDNSEQQVSADHFLRAQREAIDGLGSGDPARIQAAQIQLALLSPAFLQHCKDLMDFARDFSGKQLRAHMFRQEYASDPATWNERIDKIVATLTSSSKHLLHGRMITAQDIQQDEDLSHLKVKELKSNDAYWIILNELLLRTEIVVQNNELGKILFARDFQLISS